MRVNLTLDRVEGIMAVLILDSGEVVVLPAAQLPDGCCEGDVLSAEESGGTYAGWIRCDALRDTRMERLREKRRRLTQDRK